MSRLEYGTEIRTVLGHTYTVTVDNDPHFGPPDDDDVVTVVATGGEWADVRRVPYVAHPVTEKLLEVLETRSEAAVTRWLLEEVNVLGLHVLYRDPRDGTLSATECERDTVFLSPELSRVIAQPNYAGWAFVEADIAASELSDGADVAAVVADKIAAYNAYVLGDVFGYRIVHGARDEHGEVHICDDVAAVGGYYGIEREGDYVADEIDAEIRADAADRNIRARAAAMAAAVEAERVARVAEDNAGAARRYTSESLLLFRKWMDTDLPGMREDHKASIMNALTELGVRFDRPSP